MIVSLIIVSFVIYGFLFGRKRSVIVQPTLQKLVFYREYLFLTMIPYVYFLYDDRWHNHYIFSQLSSAIYFYYAALFSFTFIVLFLLTYRFLEPAMESSFSRVKINISYVKLRSYLNALIFIGFVYLVVVTFIYEASFVGVFKFDTLELELKRALLSLGSGFLVFNKLIIKSWIPILSYLYLYLFFKKKIFFRRIDKFYLCLSIFMGVVASLWFFEKAVIVFYLFGIVGIYVFSGNLLKIKYVLILPFVGILLVAGMYLLTYQDKIENTQYLIDILIHRTTSQSTGSVMAIDYFMRHDFFYFSGVSNLLASLNNDVFRSPYGAIIDYYVPESAATSGAMSSFVTGEAFGLFGPIGVLISGVIVGIYYSFFEATKASDFLSIIFVGLYGIYFSHFYVASSFYSFVWPVGILYSILPFFLLALLSTKKSSPTYENCFACRR